MVKDKRRAIVIGVAGLALAVFVYLWGREGGTGIAISATAGRSAAAVEDLPRIDLARLATPPEESEAGKRDVFGFGAERQPQMASHAVAPPPPPTTLSQQPPPAETMPAAPAVPPMNVKYIGSVENKTGLRVAILLTDRQEVLTGQAGEVVANRFRILKIGYESVDIQDVGSDRVRRIPFRGN